MTARAAIGQTVQVDAAAGTAVQSLITHVPQSPQLFGSVRTSVSHVVLVPQIWMPASQIHVPFWQWPLVQETPSFAGSGAASQRLVSTLQVADQQALAVTHFGNFCVQLQVLAPGVPTHLPVLHCLPFVQGAPPLRLAAATSWAPTGNPPQRPPRPVHAASGGVTGPGRSSAPVHQSDRRP
jgi:hypothetical protein